MVNSDENSIHSKTSGRGSESKVNVMGISDTDAIYSSPVAPNAPFTCTELSFLDILSQENQILVNSNQLSHLYSFNMKQ